VSTLKKLIPFVLALALLVSGIGTIPLVDPIQAGATQSNQINL